MKSELKQIKEESKKQKQTWTQSTRMGESTREVSVEELDNGGYLVSIYKSGNDKNGSYISSNKKYYSPINPLDPDGQVDPLDQVLALINKNKQL